MGKTATVVPGTTVLSAIRSAGILVESICGGKGECNKCKVIHVRGDCDAHAPAALRGLTEQEVQKNYCRACQTHVLGDCEFIIPIESRTDSPKILQNHHESVSKIDPAVTKHRIAITHTDSHNLAHRSIQLEGYRGPRPHMTRDQLQRITTSHEACTITVTRSDRFPEVIRIENGDTTARNYGLAIDLGTTTVVGVLVDLNTGRVCAESSVLNQQITHGEELLTRIALAKKEAGLKKLQSAAIDSINAVIRQLTKTSTIDAEDICDACIAGNTVMAWLLHGRDPSPLELVTVEIPREPRIVMAGALGIAINPAARVFCLPDVSRFVGGDAVGDVITSGMNRSGELSMVIDLGTNGEVILGNADWMASVSCASGPAFEGAGISSGMRAMSGAIDHVIIDPASGIVAYTTIGGVKPRGICGSGIIDAAAALVAAGILDFTGRIVSGKPGVRDGPDGPEYVLVAGEKTATGQDILITKNDMAYLIDSKAAACGAIGVLMNKYRVGIADIRHVFLAGAFGAYADTKKIVEFGIIPDFVQATIKGIGNGSLSGACAALLSRNVRDKAADIARRMVYIDLLVDADFIEEYAAAVYIPGKPEYFPRH
ncbi:ASKHA domain-containing protein [Methanoregula sp.]|uniref:ASKHA domain-containing protein n=1 Tax=Methanoregula sp. TaxID=2052170 RepID=UPI0025EFFC28|nr:ASKHA domain-containing protein [Methanoregula sp.]